MPELPEVERGRQIAERVSAGRIIDEVWSAKDDIVFDGVSPPAIRRALRGRRVIGVRRHGKYIWFELDERPWPVFHFGMTGAFRTPGEPPLALASSPATAASDWPPRFTKIHLALRDGGELAMTNARRLGRVRLLENPTCEPPIARLGFDPLLAMPTEAGFRDRIGKRSVTLKGLLLDQGFAAGVGNWIADEVLYQARLDPRRRASSLSRDEVHRLRRKLGSVIAHAVRVGADKSRFPRTWLFHDRWGRNGDARTARGQRIEHITLAGRTTAWVPSVQR